MSCWLRVLPPPAPEKTGRANGRRFVRTCWHSFVRLGKQGETNVKFAKVAMFVVLITSAVAAQVNMGQQKPEANLPFTMTTTSTFGLPWRIAFLPDGRMLVTEKIGPVWLVSADGQKIGPLAGTPAV